MNELLMNIRNKFGEINSKLGKKTRGLLAGVLGAVILFSAGTAIYLNTKPYETLFTGLNQQEASEIIGKLQESSVDYKYVNEGTLLVPKELEQKLKAQFVSEGYPKSGFTYDIFKDNIDLMTTDFEKNNYKIFDLQNRIASTISLFDGVKESKVTIALGEEKKYVLDNNAVEATAAVVVIMQDGGSPTPQQVKGIQRLVSKSIPGLKFENIAIVDGNGLDVSLSGESTQDGATQLKLDVEKEIDDTIRAKLIHQLGSIYGEENVRVTVKSTVDIDKKMREIINYTPNADNQGIPSSESIGKETTKGGRGAGGVPGAESNADIPTYTITNADGTETYIRDELSREFLVNQMKEQAQSDAGVLTDLTVSVAINGMDISNAQLNELRRFIGVTAGIATELQNDKIAIVNLPFYKPQIEVLPEVFTSDLTKWIIMGVGGFVLLLLLLIVFLVIRKMSKKRKVGTAGAGMAGSVVMAPKDSKGTKNQGEPSVDLLSIKNDRGIELKEQIRDFSDENPEISAQLIKSWLNGGQDNG